MRMPGAISIVAILCAGLALTAVRADDGDSGDLRSMPPVKQTWWSEMFGNKNKPETVKPVMVESMPVRPTVADPMTVQAREESIFHRRMQVCDDLLEYADKKGDDAMREQVYHLMDRAWEIYQLRTGGPAARVNSKAVDAAALTRPAQARPDVSRQASANTGSPVSQ